MEIPSRPLGQQDKKCRGTKPSHKGAAAYQLGNTSSRTITEVKQR